MFISWSGKRSEALAEALRHWLPLILHYVDPWLSKADIDAGKRWSDVVAGELEASNFGIICVSRQSAAAPWPIFEAGALAKSREGSAIPLLLDLEFQEITGPLAQFQAKKADKTGVRETVQAINAAAAEPIPDGRLNDLFDALWPQLQQKIEAIPSEYAPSQPTRSQVEVLEELVGAVRSLDARMRDQEHTVWSVKSRRSRQWQAKEAIRLVHSLSAENDPAAILIAGSLFREEAPWIYDLAVEYHRAVRRHDTSETKRVLATLRAVFSASSRSRNAMIGYEDTFILDVMERFLRGHHFRTARPKGPPPAPPPPEVKETVSGPSEPGDGHPAEVTALAGGPSPNPAISGTGATS